MEPNRFNLAHSSIPMKPIPSILDLPLPNALNNLFQHNEQDSLLALNLTDPSLNGSSSDGESIESPYASSPQHISEKSSTSIDRTKGIWNAEEDEALRQAISMVKGNISWEDISKKVPGRNPKQCRERWLYRLCPGVNKTPFQKWEDELIVIERQKIGNHWTAIASKLPGRTSYAVKNRWYTVLRNRISHSAVKSTGQSQKYAPVNQYTQPPQIVIGTMNYGMPNPYYYQPQAYLVNYV